jgi:hypothetical protein
MAGIIEIRNNFFYLNGQRWSPKGVCYQPQDGVDPLSDDKLSVILSLVNGDWKTLGINSIRVYQVDPTLPHDQVMQYLAANNIYVEVGAVTAGTSIHSDNPQYTAAFLKRIKSVADAFAKYDNVLYFSISNEAINPDNGKTPGYAIPSIVKAGARDLRAYMAQKGYRNVPVGCAERDAPEYTIQAAAAYMCGPANERLDILGYNCYRWAGGDLQGHLNAYYQLCQQFMFNGATPVIPVIMTEFGANTIQPRPFDDVPYLFGTKAVVSNGNSINMADLFSGGYVFRYEEDGNQFGLVGKDGKPTSFGGYDNLKREYNAISGFVPGTPNTSGTLNCDPTNPYNQPLPPAPGGGNGIPNDITVTVTNIIKDVTSIKLNCKVDGNWETVLTMSGGQAPAKAVIPAGTTDVQVIYLTKDTNKWLQACGVEHVATLKNNDTILGDWKSPDGLGFCTIG